MDNFLISGASQQQLEWLHYFLNHREDSLLEFLIAEDLRVMEQAYNSYAAGFAQKQECAWICQKLLSKLDAYARATSLKELEHSCEVQWPECLDEPLKSSREVPDFCLGDYSDLTSLDEKVGKNYHERPIRQYPNPLDLKDWSGEILGTWFQTPNCEMTNYYLEMVRKRLEW